MDRVQHLLSDVPEGGVANVMAKGSRFHKVFVQAKRPGDGAGDLCDLKGVR
jgi:hypothetical protein